MSTIIKKKLPLITKEKTPSINQISEKFVQGRYFDGESVQVRQFCY